MRAAAIALLIAAALTAQKPPPAGVEEQLPKPPPEQPIPFSHKTHVAKAGVKCLDCHPIREPGFQAGIPREAVCMGCHASVKKESPHIQKLAALADAKQPVPWVRIYQVPDFVWFSHQSHATEKKIECVTCHGPVAERDALGKEKPTNMFGCVRCHDERGASKGCDLCHNAQ